MRRWAPTKYKITNRSSCSDRLRQRGSLAIWVDPQMVWVPPPSGKRGRQQQFSDAAIQTCLTLKVLFGMVDIGAPLVRVAMSTRQTTGLVESFLRLVGLNCAVPDFSRLYRPLPGRRFAYKSAERGQKTLNVSRPYRGGTGPLNLLIDSTGIKSEGEGEWGLRPFRAEMIPWIVSGTPLTPQAWQPDTPDLAQDTYRDQ